MPDKDRQDSIQPELAKPAGNVSGTLEPKLTGKQIIREAVRYVNEHISRQPPVQRFFSFMPTMLTRVSPFHFKGRHKSNEWPLVRLDSGAANSWGSMQVVGELLIIFDTARTIAEDLAHSTLEELFLYIVHGLLHLNGHLDKEEPDRITMHRIQNRIWSTVLGY